MQPRPKREPLVSTWRGAGLRRRGGRHIFLACTLGALGFAVAPLLALRLTAAALIRLGFRLLRSGRQNHGYVATLAARSGLDGGDLGEFLGESTQQTHALLGAGLLATLETKIKLHLVAAIEEAFGLALLRLVVVAVNLQPDTDGLDDGVGLVMTSSRAF